MRIDDSERVTDLVYGEARTEVKCAGGCGRTLFKGTPQDEDSDFYGYKVVEPFAFFPSLVRVISETKQVDGTVITIRETPETCLRIECIDAVVRRDKKWSIVDFAAERAKRKARHVEAARLDTEDTYLKQEAERAPLQECADKARAACFALLGAADARGVNDTLDAAARTFKSIAAGKLTGAQAGALADAFAEAAAAGHALDAHWDAVHPRSRPLGAL